MAEEERLQEEIQAPEVITDLEKPV